MQTTAENFVRHIVTLQWHQFEPTAIIPTKSWQAAGYDLYTVEDEVWIKPHERHLFDTGLGVIPSDNCWLRVIDRGSTGSKGIHTHCGVVDTDYRGRLFVCLNNDNNYPVLFSRTKEPGMHRTWYGRKYLVYPLTKAIAQIVPVFMPQVQLKPCSEAEWLESVALSQRGTGKLGSSNK